MAGFYKVLLRGVSQGQEINNIIYYAPLAPLNETFEELVATDLGEAVNAAWKSTCMTLISNQYAFQGSDVTMVDENGDILSPFVVSVSDTGAGGQTSAIDGPGRVIIAKFNCTPVSQASGHPVPRRSYLAIGPIAGDAIGTTGILLNQVAWQAQVTPMLTQGHLISGTEYLPYRVGRTTGGTESQPTVVPAGVGRVHSVVARPYTSFRRSRMASPTGN